MVKLIDCLVANLNLIYTHNLAHFIVLFAFMHFEFVGWLSF